MQACINCHGPGGAGEPPVYPYLAGQHASYLKTALEEWKSGKRTNDPSGQMNTIAKRLSDGDIAALSGYYASLTPPPASAFWKNVPQGTPERPVKNVPSPHNEAAPITGTGSEQGQATGGGAQGIGGGGAASGSGPQGSNGTPQK